MGKTGIEMISAFLSVVQRRDDVNGEGEDLMLARLRFSFVLVGLSPVVCLYGLLVRKKKTTNKRDGP